MKKKLFIFIGLITLSLSFMLVTPKPKASDLYVDYDAMVVGWEDAEYVWITYFDLDGTWNRQYNVANIRYNTEEIILTEDYLFKNGTKLKVTSYTDTMIYANLYLDENDVPEVIYQTNYISLDKMYRDVETHDLNLLYIGTGINDKQQDMLYFVDGSMNYYQIVKSTFMYYYDGFYNLSQEYSIERTITVGLDLGNIYRFQPHYTSIIPKWSSSLSYELGVGIGLKNLEEDVNKAYNLGKADALREIEFIKLQYKEIGKKELDPYIKSLQEKAIIEYNRGVIEGRKQVDNIDAYNLGYDDGYEDGMKDKSVENNENFYKGIEKWLVPAIIVVLFGGGFLAFRRKQQEG